MNVSLARDELSADPLPPEHTSTCVIKPWECLLYTGTAMVKHVKCWEIGTYTCRHFRGA